MKRTFRDGWTMTVNKTRFNLMDPDHTMVYIGDILHGMAIQNRFYGQTIRPYSIAEHLVRCCDQAVIEGYSDSKQLAILIHDFSETWYGDVASPIKAMLGERYKQYECLAEKIIESMILGHESDFHDDVKIIDNRMLITECRDIAQHEDWWGREGKPYDWKIPQDEFHWTYWRDQLFSRLDHRMSIAAKERVGWRRYLESRRNHGTT